jgi:2-deoxy-D-gluconate 3-dehydrogenase
LACDLLDEAAVGDLVPRAIALFGGLDILVNNAGGDADAPAIDYPLDKWRHIMTLDLEVPFRLCQAAAQHFMTTGKGAIINVCSILGLTGLTDACSYVAAKHGLVGVTKGIRVNAVAPGLIKTDLTEYIWGTEPGQHHIRTSIPARRIGQPADIGAAVVFLASDGADFIHGETLVVDGGFLAT